MSKLHLAPTGEVIDVWIEGAVNDVEIVCFKGKGSPNKAFDRFGQKYVRDGGARNSFRSTNSKIPLIGRNVVQYLDGRSSTVPLATVSSGWG